MKHLSFYLAWACSALVPLGNAQNLRDFLGGYNGTLVLPGQPAYANASRAFNLRYDYEPAAVAYPTTVEEISRILTLANTANYHVVPRSGGHSYIANGVGGKDGSIVVDLGSFKAITVDPTSGYAKIGAGNKLGEIVTALNNNGRRALPHGTCAYVGIGGHAGYGGFGFTSRLWGLSVDAVVAADIVLANGTAVSGVSEKKHADLFWALRGAAPSFGIVTSYMFKTFLAPPEATIFSYNWQLTAGGAASFLLAFQDWALHTPVTPEWGGEIVITKGNERGNVTIGVAGGWYRPLEELNATMQGLFDRVPPFRTSSFDTGDYLHSAINLAGGSLDTTEPGGTDTFYAKSLIIPSKQPIGKKAAEKMMEVISMEGFDTTVGFWFYQVALFGGTGSAINSVPLKDTAFGHRDGLFSIQFYASSSGNVPPFPADGFEYLDNTVNALIENSPPGWDYGAYTNYADDRLVDWKKRYYGANYPRLRRLKEVYDPKGTFSFPIGIEE